MKRKTAFLFLTLICLAPHFSNAQEKPKAKHLLPNGEPDRPFTFFVKHGFAAFTDAQTQKHVNNRPAYFFGLGTRVEDDDKDSPVFLEVDGLYHFITSGDSLNNSVNTVSINMNILFVLLSNTSKTFRWNAGTGVNWNSITDDFISHNSKQFGFNFTTQFEMLLKHKRFNIQAGYRILPFADYATKQYSYNTLSLGMGFYFR